MLMTYRKRKQLQHMQLRVATARLLHCPVDAHWHKSADNLLCICAHQPNLALSELRISWWPYGMRQREDLAVFLSSNLINYRVNSRFSPYS
jgi:hypothetical protein